MRRAHSRNPRGNAKRGSRIARRRDRPDAAPRKTVDRRRGVAIKPRNASPAAIERVLAPQDWKSLAPLFPSSTATVEEVVSRLQRHCGALLAWNRRVSNLISKNDEARIVARHVSESLAPARWMAELGIDEWLDFGSGAGFPALPLAIAGIGKRWTLVESRRPKILFLRKVLSEIETDAKIEVVGARLESVSSDSYQVGAFTARATEGLSTTLAIASTFVRIGGSAFLWKGSRWTEEIENDRSWSSWWRLIERRAIADSPISVARFERI